MIAAIFGEKFVADASMEARSLASNVKVVMMVVEGSISVPEHVAVVVPVKVQPSVMVLVVSECVLDFFASQPEGGGCEKRRIEYAYASETENHISKEDGPWMTVAPSPTGHADVAIEDLHSTR